MGRSDWYGVLSRVNDRARNFVLCWRLSKATKVARMIGLAFVLCVAVRVYRVRVYS